MERERKRQHDESNVEEGRDSRKEGRLLFNAACTGLYFSEDKTSVGVDVNTHGSTFREDEPFLLLLIECSRGMPCVCSGAKLGGWSSRAHRKKRWYSSVLGTHLLLSRERVGG